MSQNNIPRWQQVLQEELDAAEPTARFVLLGEYIAGMRDVLTDLATQRRETALQIVEEGTDPATLADEVGTTERLVRRLVAEARSTRAAARRREEART